MVREEAVPLPQGRMDLLKVSKVNSSSSPCRQTLKGPQVTPDTADKNINFLELERRLSGGPESGSLQPPGTPVSRDWTPSSGVRGTCPYLSTRMELNCGFSFQYWPLLCPSTVTQDPEEACGVTSVRGHTSKSKVSLVSVLALGLS